MMLEQIIVGPLGVNCYIIGCEATKKAAIIDPGADHKKIKILVEKNNLTPIYIINTHGHLDHIGSNAHLKDIYPDIKILV